MGPLTTNDVGAAVTVLVAMLGGGGLWTWLSARQKSKTDATTGIAAFMESNNKLSQMLLNERADREKEFTRVRQEMEGLRGELHERGEQLERAEDDRTALWLYVGQLETLLREGGLTLPARPARLTEIADHHSVRRPAPRRQS